jgi:hypothetical protein
VIGSVANKESLDLVILDLLKAKVCRSTTNGNPRGIMKQEEAVELFWLSRQVSAPR